MKRFIGLLSLLSLLLSVFMPVSSFAKTAPATQTISGKLVFACDYTADYLKSKGYTYIGQQKYGAYNTNKFGAPKTKIIVKDKNGKVIGTSSSNQTGAFSFPVNKQSVYKIESVFNNRKKEFTISNGKTTNLVIDFGRFLTDTKTLLKPDHQAVQTNKKGNLKGDVTWQYNKFIGTKPDVGAKVFLIPVNFNKDLMTDSDAGNFAAIGSIPSDLENELFFTKVSGFGHYEINNIPVGEYNILIVSNNTNSVESEPSQYATEVLQPHVKDWDTFSLFNLKMKKYELSSINIKENQTLDVSYDFGYTDF